MHRFQAKSGTVFNFNSDLSGDVECWRGAIPLGIPAADLLEFVDWYRRTPGYGVDEEALNETLTEEERAEIDSWGDHGPMDNAEYLASKLLRLHDALQARVKELEGQLDQVQRARWEREEKE